MEDDEELERIGEEYSAGRMLTGEVKKRLGDVVAEVVREHQDRDSEEDHSNNWARNGQVCGEQGCPLCPFENEPGEYGICFPLAP